MKALEEKKDCGENNSRSHDLVQTVYSSQQVEGKIETLSYDNYSLLFYIYILKNRNLLLIIERKHLTEFKLRQN